MTTRVLEPKRIKCDKCGYEWYTRSRKKYVSCPNCASKTRNPHVTEEAYSIRKES